MKFPSTFLLRNLLALLLITSITIALLLVVRFLLVEPDEVAMACSGQVIAFSCKIRNAAIYGFAHHLFGPVSLVAALLAWVGALRLFALVAIVAGIAGMVLYDFDLSGFGMLLGVVLYLRLCLQRLRVAQTGQ
ncbi:MAG: hypothetical protein ABUL58_08390 [Steroidobacter sp.]